VKRLIKKITIGLLLLSLVVCFGPKIYAFYQGAALEKQGDRLLTSNKYQQALEKYSASREKWEDKTISEKVSSTQDLIESDNNFQAGNKLINDGKWDKAILKLSLVKSNHKDYERARSLIAYTKDKINEEKKSEVLGLTKERVYKKSAPTITITPTPILISTVPTSIPVLNQTPTQQPTSILQDSYNEYKAKYDECPQYYFDCNSRCSDQYIAQIRENDNIRQRLSGVNPLEVDEITRKNTEDAKQRLNSCKKSCCDTWKGAGYRGCDGYCSY
jgi:hypothetical protein